MKYPIHRRNIAQQTQQGTLIVDAPLDGNGLDYSGNNNNLTAGSNVQWATDGGRQVLSPAQYSYFNLTTINQSSYINDFQIEIDYFPINLLNPANQQMIDGAAAGTQRPGIFIMHNPISGSTPAGFYFTLIYTATSEVSVSIPDTAWTLNRWYKIIWKNTNNLMTVTITDISSGTVIFNQNIATNTVGSTPLPNLRIGQTQHTSNRSINGYLRNFKLYKL